MEIINNDNFISVSTLTLEFKIASRATSERPEIKINVQNNVANPIALRVKTTKKDSYNVNPTYTFIPALAKLDISFILYITENFDETAKHKFLIEAINYDPKLEFDNAKKYFEYCSINKLKLGGRIIKLTSTFHFLNNNPVTLEKSSTSFRESKIEDPRGEINVVRGGSIPMRRTISIMNENTKIENENEIEEIKSEFYKLSNRHSNLIEQNKDLRQKLENEKSFTSFPSYVAEEYIGEKQYSKNFMYFAFALSVIIGFILSR